MNDEEYEDLRRLHIEVIMNLEREYRKAIEPYLKRLSDLDAIRPRSYLVREGALRFLQDLNSDAAVTPAVPRARSKYTR